MRQQPMAVHGCLERGIDRWFGGSSGLLYTLKRWQLAAGSTAAAGRQDSLKHWPLGVKSSRRLRIQE
ncbi:hypothetical protein AAC387_Pa01g2304 [Persea americana]